MADSALATHCKTLAIPSSKRDQDFTAQLLEAEKEQDLPAQSWCHFGKAKHFLLIGDMISCLKSLDRAESLFLRLGCDDGLAYLSLEKGKALAITGDLSEGRCLMQTAVARARVLGNRRLEAVSLASLAFSYGNRTIPSPMRC